MVIRKGVALWLWLNLLIIIGVFILFTVIWLKVLGQKIVLLKFILLLLRERYILVIVLCLNIVTFGVALAGKHFASYGKLLRLSPLVRFLLSYRWFRYLFFVAQFYLHMLILFFIVLEGLFLIEIERHILTLIENKWLWSLKLLLVLGIL